MPPSPSGIADYVAEQAPELARHAEVRIVDRDPGPDAEMDTDLDIYHLGNSPHHAYIYRAALHRPGVVVLHEWNLHHLVLRETVERGDVFSYLREMRHAHGDVGTFVGRQVARGLGGEILPALFPLGDRILEGSLAVVGLTRWVQRQAERRLPGRPILHLPLHLALPLHPLPSKEEARQALGLPAQALILTAPGLATQAKRLDLATRAVARLRERYPSLTLVVAGGVDRRLPLEAWAREAGLGAHLLVTGRLSLEDFVRHLCAADIILALRFPSYGEISAALVRALGVGRPALVTAGTPAAEEFPEGIVVPVDPGLAEEDQLEALLEHLLRNPGLRDTIGHLARAHVSEHHDIGATTRRLAVFVEEVLAGKDAALSAILSERAPEEGLFAYLMEEVRWGARDLGLAGPHRGVGALLRELVGGKR